MSTFAAPSPAVARLFEMVDSAEPETPLLRKAYRHWQAKRGPRVLPHERAMKGFPVAFDAEAFVFERRSIDNDWTLHLVGEIARGLLRPDTEDWRLTALASRRVAARLRRLFEMVAEAAEPLAASFEIDDQAGRRFVEVLVCPLEADDANAQAVSGVIMARSQSATPPAAASH